MSVHEMQMKLQGASLEVKHHESDFLVLRSIVGHEKLLDSRVPAHEIVTIEAWALKFTVLSERSFPICRLSCRRASLTSPRSNPDSKSVRSSIPSPIGKNHWSLMPNDEGKYESRRRALLTAVAPFLRQSFPYRSSTLFTAELSLLRRLPSSPQSSPYCGSTLFTAELSLQSTITLVFAGLFAGAVVLLVCKGSGSQNLVFSEDLFFLYLLLPIIFNAGSDPAQRVDPCRPQTCASQTKKQ
ncbi:putative sodium/hydrogen exchanger [Corchorus olitorius]|uniref:Sodium/hydrogen exchanger n=1 Tax=Corchorus olitorius TaxID=93759 RepID=A0A1R3G0P8_9ROSI|nr:putative sodium/hydrogen exchanger [Corchorus olitorius]